MQGKECLEEYIHTSGLLQKYPQAMKLDTIMNRPSSAVVAALIHLEGDCSHNSQTLVYVQ